MLNIENTVNGDLALDFIRKSKFMKESIDKR